VILDRIETVAGGRVESASEPIDTKTAAGKLNRNVMMDFAAFESDLKSEQWIEAQQRRIRLKLMPGGPAPFGYVKADGRDQPPVSDPALAPIIAKLYDDYLKGHGFQKLTKGLNDAGVTTTPRKYGDAEKVGRAFTTVTLTRFLDSGFAAGYIKLNIERTTDGKVVRNPRRIPGAHQAIITEETWQEYQRLRGSRRDVHPRARQPRWHLGGIAVCGSCGANLNVNTTAADGQAYCSKYKAERKCPGVWMNRTAIETLVAMWLGGHIDDWAAQQEQFQGVDSERTDLGRELRVARAELGRIDDGRKVINRQTVRGVITEAEADAALAESDVERAEIVARIDAIQRRLDLLSPDADVYERLARGTEGQSPEEWNLVLKRVIERITVNKQTVTIKPWRGESTVIDRATAVPRAPRKSPVVRDHTGRFVPRTDT
jgi:site-specific DNA recombinase